MSRNHRKLSSLIRGGLIACMLFASGSIAAGGTELVVIVNAKNATTKLSKSDLRRIFQTNKSTWDDGTAITALNLPEGNELRQDFDKAVLGMDKDEVAKYWTDRKIRGGARPPRKASSTSAVAKVVADDAGAIGYVKSTEVNGAVRKVAMVRGNDVL